MENNSWIQYQCCTKRTGGTWWPIKFPYVTNCFPTLGVGNITKIAIFQGEDQSFGIPIHSEICSTMYKDYLDGFISLLKVYNKNYWALKY